LGRLNSKQLKILSGKGNNLALVRNAIFVFLENFSPRKFSLVPTAISFDSGATHSFISVRYVNTNELPLQTMQKPMIVITPKGLIEANYMTNRLTLTIMGREF
jgi:hypothetical protein